MNFQRVEVRIDGKLVDVRSIVFGPAAKSFEPLKGSRWPARGTITWWSMTPARSRMRRLSFGAPPKLLVESGNGNGPRVLSEQEARAMGLGELLEPPGKIYVLPEQGAR